MENKTERSIHRVGTMTSGIALIVFGILFLLHMIVPTVGILRDKAQRTLNKGTSECQATRASMKGSPKSRE